MMISFFAIEMQDIISEDRFKIHRTKLLILSLIWKRMKEYDYCFL